VNLNNGEFTTKVKGEWFFISITEESDISVDGGHTFEDATNQFELDVDKAKERLRELTRFCGQFT